MGLGPQTTENVILEIGVSLLALGLALITGWLVGGLVAKRQYGAMVPLGLLLAAVALLLWWEPLIRVVVSFSLLLIGYTWLFAWWRASRQGSDWLLSTSPVAARATLRRLGAACGEEHQA